MKYNSIGIVGGFGPFATLDFFQRFLIRFQSNCDRNYPRIVMDNNFKMPSRTKSLLDGSDRDVIVKAIAHSMELMLREEMEKIILVCGTAHCFLGDVFSLVPEAESHLLHIVDALGTDLKQARVGDAVVLAAEGALSQDLYGSRLNYFHVKCETPGKGYYSILRYFIESVKQNRLDKGVLKEFVEFLKNFSSHNVILGCTEFPIIVDRILHYPTLAESIQQYRFWDPLESVLNLLE